MSRKTESRRVYDQVLVETTCNGCGITMRWTRTRRGMIPDIEHSEGRVYHNFKLSGYYSSTCPPDGVTLSFDLCDNCLAGIITTFKVPPTETRWI